MNVGMESRMQMGDRDGGQDVKLGSVMGERNGEGKGGRREGWEAGEANGIRKAARESGMMEGIGIGGWRKVGPERRLASKPPSSLPRT